VTARRAASRGPRLFEEPLFFRRTREDIAELSDRVWLALELARLLRSRFEGRSAASPPRGYG